MVAGPSDLTVGVLQGLVRDGFDFARHPLSVLANGPGGWIETANFVITGALVVATAVGFRRVLGPKSRGMRWFLGGFGVAMIVRPSSRRIQWASFPPYTRRVSHLDFDDRVDPFRRGLWGSPSSPSLVSSPRGRGAAACGNRQLRHTAVAALPDVLQVPAARVSSGHPGIRFAVVVGWAWLAVLSIRLSAWIVSRPAARVIGFDASCSA